MKYFVLAVCVIGGAIARPDGAGGHHHAHAHTSPTGPTGGYQEPVDPGTGYAQPSGYSAPNDYSSGYGNSVYSSGYGAVEEEGIDLSMLLIPVLIIAGLALLFPAVVTVEVRKKRNAEDEVSGNSLVERIQDIYSSVLQSEECMERVACEVGGIVSEAGVSSNIMRAAEPFVSKKYSKLMKQFSAGKDCHKIKCGSLF